MFKLFILTLCFFAISCSSKKDQHQNKHASNKKFMDDDIDVKIWQEKFENRKRDVYKNRVAIADALNLGPGDVVADIGAGTGIYLSLLNSRVSPSGKVMAVDIAPSFVKFLRLRAKKENLTLVEVIRGSLDRSNLAPSSVDKIFVCDTFHHFDKSHLMLRDFYRILKPGGELIIVDFDKVAGKSRPWILSHISKTKKEYIRDISRYFKFEKESKIGLEENFMIHFTKPQGKDV